MLIRPALSRDAKAIWAIIGPIIRAGETYALDRDLWQFLGFDIVGNLPQAFLHPSQGYVDALVMFKTL